MKLQCACCGGYAPARKQWFNQDTGYGVCPRCFDSILAKETKTLGDEAFLWCVRTYGVPGVHHSLEATPETTERAKQALRDYNQSAKAAQGIRMPESEARP